MTTAATPSSTEYRVFSEAHGELWGPQTLPAQELRSLDCMGEVPSGGVIYTVILFAVGVKSPLSSSHSEARRRKKNNQKTELTTVLGSWRVISESA